MKQPPLIFITNDDGIGSAGIRALAEAVGHLGQIIIVAPDGARSGQASAITVDTPLRINRVEFTNGIEAYSINGTPVDCVKLGMHAVMQGRRPSILLSGINHGSNSGNSVIYSGTMGAVMEGNIIGIPSIGFSLLDHRPDADFSLIQPMVEEITRKVLDHGLPQEICLNVNFPKNRVPEGIRVATAARGRWTEEYAAYTAPNGQPFYMLTGRYINDNPDDPTTDNYWLDRGYATIVPVRPDQTAPDHLQSLTFLS